jgi:hypothetical protein
MFLLPDSLESDLGLLDHNLNLIHKRSADSYRLWAKHFDQTGASDKVLVPRKREKVSSEMHPYEKWRHADRASLSSRLTLQSNRRHVRKRVFDYDTSETSVVQARLPLRSNRRHAINVARIRFHQIRDEHLYRRVFDYKLKKKKK